MSSLEGGGPMVAAAAIEPAVRVGDPGGSRIPTRDPGHRRAERVMGTVISLVAPDGGAASAAADRAFAWLHEVDRRFSPFRPDSEVSQLSRSSVLDQGTISADMAEVLGLCEIAEALSDGAFDIRRHRPDGAPDPTGVVKGWAVDRAGAILETGGITRFCLAAGGDVLARGGRAAGLPWRVGIAHPTVRGATALTLEAGDLAVATSGITERGEHIVDGRTGRVAREVLSLSVAGPELGRADAYATAAFAMGRDGLRWVESLPGYAACATTPDDRLLVSRGLGRYLPTPERGSTWPACAERPR